PGPGFLAIAGHFRIVPGGGLNLAVNQVKHGLADFDQSPSFNVACKRPFNSQQIKGATIELLWRMRENFLKRFYCPSDQSLPFIGGEIFIQVNWHAPLEISAGSDQP